MKKILYIWLASILLFGITFLLFIKFMLDLTLPNMLLLATFLFAASICLSLANSSLPSEDAFELFYALWFYHQCKKISITSHREFLKNKQLVKSISSSHILTKEKSYSELEALFLKGKQFTLIPDER